MKQIKQLVQRLMAVRPEVVDEQDKPKKKLVLAGNFRQYKMYCYSKRLHPFEDAHYIGSYEEILGAVRGTELIKVGTWYERNDANAILKFARSHQFEIITDWI